MAIRRPIKILLTGAPGSGKGTFGSRLSPVFEIPAISTGDLIRAEIKKNSDLGKRIKKTTESGNLIDDQTAFELMKGACAKNKGYMLDGFPRRVSQALLWDKYDPLDLVVNIDLDEDVLVLKSISRRVCDGCGRGYNLAEIIRPPIQMEALLPKKDGVCDDCGGKLITRKDDTEAIVRHRLKVYNDETKPLIEHYQAQGKLANWKVLTGIRDTPALIEMIKKELAKRK